LRDVANLELESVALFALAALIGWAVIFVHANWTISADDVCDIGRSVLAE